MLALLLIAALIFLLLFFFIVRTVIGLVLLFVVAGVCGIIAEAITGYRTGSAIYTVAVGIIGGVIGSLLARALGLPRLIELGGLYLIWTIVGAVILLVVLKIMAPRGIG